MVIRSRLRAILFPLLLLSFSGPLAAYFVWHAVNGNRGIKAKEEYRTQMVTLNAEKAALQKDKAALERRIVILRGNVIDRELLDEEARAVLNRVHKNDVVIYSANIK